MTTGGQSAAGELIVYTCVAGRYEQALTPAPTQDGTRFICFTNSPRHIRAEGWDVRPLMSPRRLASGHDINRFHKIFAHRLFPEARWSVYLDGNLSLAGEYRDLTGPVERAGAALGAFWHPRGHDLTTEVEACKRFSKFDTRDIALVEAQLALYATHGIAPDTPIPTNWVLVRDHRAAGLELAMDVWWAQLFEFTKRDQISLLYALSCAGVKWQPLDGEGQIDPARVMHRWHTPPLLQRIRRKLDKRFRRLNKG